ncbi:MAG: beta-ketoacyl-[acyl-carrier-protein] synthase family protein [Firmicutes bacterium]|nr:beta-ketoacyl-[acyl-carrier-protein] synthase family protein [Bacillota bacterium]
MRVVVTGLGTVQPFGVGVDSFRQGLREGRSAVRRVDDEITARYVRVVAAVPEFVPGEHLTHKQVTDTDRFTQLALVAAREALHDAGIVRDERISGILPRRIGVALGSAFGGVQTLEQGAAQLAVKPTGRVSPRLVSKAIPNAAAGAIAMAWDLEGPVVTYATACASSANAIGEAVYWLRAGVVDAVLAGGAESLYTPSILAGLGAAGALARTGPADERAWSRPFDRDRQGMVMGEGAAMLVLEPYDRALVRGAHIYGELIGYGASNDAYHETSPHPQGRGAAQAMSSALEAAHLDGSEVGYINAHATATPAGDAAEGAALRTVFGELIDRIPVSSIKGAVGHLLGTAGAIESLTCLLALDEGWLPPTLHCADPETWAPRDLVPDRAREQQVEVALSNSFGFGGQNAALVWRRHRQGG